MKKKSNKSINVNESVPKKCKIKLQDRVFVPLTDNPDILVTDAGSQKAFKLKKTLNLNALKYKLGEIFSFNRSTNQVKVSRKDYDTWREKIAFSTGNTPARQKILAKDRVFKPLIENPNIFATNIGNQLAFSVETGLNKNALSLGFEQIFSANAEENRVEISRQNYELWKEKQGLSLSQAPKSRNKIILAKDRIFVPLNDNSDMLYTNAGNHKDYGLAKTLNVKANELGLDDIFRSNKSDNRVEISRANFDLWNEKLSETSSNEDKSYKGYVERILLSDRKFVLSTENPDLVVTYAGTQLPSTVCISLNRNARKLELNSIFSSCRVKNRVEECSNWWTEDYMMQFMMVAAFGREAVGIVDDKLLTLTRMKRVTNTCAKKFVKAQVHLQ